MHAPNNFRTLGFVCSLLWMTLRVEGVMVDGVDDDAEKIEHHVRRNLLKGHGTVPPKVPPPVIFDTDYGPFIDDVFALGLIINSADLLDLKMVITTSENPTLSAKCAAKHLDLSGASDIPVLVGSEFPDYAKRGSVCAIPGLLGFALEAECSDVDLPVVKNGVKKMADMIMASDRSDWWYIVVGGQTSLKDLILNHSEAASKINTVIVMGGNFCQGFFPYPGVRAPTDETNIGCDPEASNTLLDKKVSSIPNVYYVPVEVADEIGGTEYQMIVEAANSGNQPAAKATLDFYRSWSKAARADPNLLVHAEALLYDPETESTPQFDPCAVMFAMELLDEKKCEDHTVLYSMMARFIEPGEKGIKPFPEAPRAAYTLHNQKNFDKPLPDQCPKLTEFTFRPLTTPRQERGVKVTLGFASKLAKKRFYTSMAERIAGVKTSKCA